MLKKELINLGIAFVSALIIVQIVFYKEGVLNVLKIVVMFFWMLVIPGNVIMLYWKEKLGFLERFIIGTVLGAAVFGIVSYYVALVGLHVKYHWFVLPIVLIALGLFISRKKIFSP
ncbi:MAG: hypothetical protein GY861_08835 [bacterium]|nr:hypothetical protein [bacterium]